MANYADHDFYTTTYGGTAIAQTEWSLLAQKASAFIDRVTFGEAADVISEDTDEEKILKIQLATCYVAETIKSNEAGGVISSESVGPHSVSYVTKFVLSDVQKMKAAARLYLADTELMYAGLP